MDTVLLLIIRIPLINISVHNEPIQDPQFTCITSRIKTTISLFLEWPYVAVSKHSMYPTLATGHDIHICMATQGYLYMMNQTLYPLEHTKWFVLVHFIWDHECTDKHCLSDSKLRHANMAVSLGG